ncbi:MAG: hypothetical protein ACI8SE_000774 [Bacteroidia bacterium]|jgi:hypothetical protein
MKKALISILILTLQYSVMAQNTWSKNVAQIVYDNCSNCHNPNGIAPFSLLTYADVKPNAFSIKASVESGNMPPWIADTKYQSYAHERVLTAAEKAAIIDWVDNGSPEGDANKTPPPPVFGTKGFISQKPDLELKMPVYASKATSNGDDYVCFSVPTNLASDKKIRGFEVIPGNHSIVHHALVYLDATGNYPTDTTQGVCTGPTNGLIGGYVPGSPPTIFPTNGTDFNLGFTVKAGSNIVLAMHYPEGSFGKVDSTIIRFWFYDDATQIRELTTSPLIENWQFLLPANKETKVNATRNTGNVDYSILSVFPHMHLLGSKIGSYAVTSTNDTIPFVNIPQWDFEWQEFLFFKKIKKLPKFSTIYGHGTYDNTTKNTHNPNNPPVLVRPGLNTTDEMFLIYFHYLQYQKGDEDRDIEAMTSLGIGPAPRLNIGVYPNPAAEQISFDFESLNAKNVQLRVYDLQGKMIWENPTELNGHMNRITWQIPAALTSGVYFYSVNADGVMTSGSFLLKH